MGSEGGRVESRYARFTEGRETLTFIGYRSLTVAALKLFEWFSERFKDPKSYVALDFHELLKIRGAGSVVTYVAWHTMVHQDAGLETCLFLCETTRRGKLVGHGEIRFEPMNQDRFFKDKPFVGYSATEEAYGGKGLGLERLVRMNALTLALWGLYLHSDTHIIGGIQSTEYHIWSRLVEMENVARYMEGKQERFKFIKPEI